MFYTAIKHSRNVSLVFSNACLVLSQCNTRLRLLYLLIKENDMVASVEMRKLYYIFEHSQINVVSPRGHVVSSIKTRGEKLDGPS